MIEIVGHAAFIQIDIVRFVTDNKWWGSGDYIECDFYYRNADITFVSRNVGISFDLLAEFHHKLKRLLRNGDCGCFLGDRDYVVALDFTTNKNGNGYVIDFELLYYYGIDLTCKGDMLVSEESLQKFEKEIEFLL